MTNEDEEDYTKWLKEARRAGKLYWAYEELVDDNPDDARSAFERGDNPYDYIKQVGEELDLHKFGVFWGS